MADEPELQEGISGEWVQYLQRLLQSAGYWSGGETGEFGPELSAAVQTFQSAYNLYADGVVRAEVWGVLTGETNQSTDGNQSGTVLDANEFPEILALVNASDWESYVRDVVGVDPQLFTEDEAIT